MFEVKKVGIADLEELRHIGIESYVPHYNHLWKPGGLDWYLKRCFGRNFLQKEIADSNVEYYIVSSTERDVGMMKLVLQKNLPDSEIWNALYLEKIYLVKDWTGKGVGHQVMKLAFERAQKLNCELIWLVAMDTSDKPIAAYQKAGFEIHTHQNLDFDLMKEEFRGTLVMKKNLKENGN